MRTLVRSMVPLVAAGGLVLTLSQCTTPDAVSPTGQSIRKGMGITYPVVTYTGARTPLAVGDSELVHAYIQMAADSATRPCTNCYFASTNERIVHIAATSGWGTGTIGHIYGDSAATASFYSDTVGNSAAIGSYAVVVTSSYTPNLPSGMTVVVNTGQITGGVPSSAQQHGGVFSVTGPTGLTLQLTNQSPNTPDGNGSWAGNFVSPPSGQTGISVNFPTTLNGGSEPVRLSANGFANNGNGNIYIAFVFTLSPEWSFSKAGEVKIMAPSTVASGNNDIVALEADGPNGQEAQGYALPAFALQGNSTGYVPSGQNADGLPPSYAPSPTQYGSDSTIANIGSSANVGRSHLIEYYVQQETTNGSSGDANLTIWIDGTKVYTTVGISGTHFNLWASTGWGSFVLGNDYGGDQSSDHPPAGVYDVYDRFFIAVK